MICLNIYKKVLKPAPQQIDQNNLEGLKSTLKL